MIQSKRLVILSLIAIMFIGCKESVPCKDYKEGRFSVVPEDMDVDFLIIRNGKSQVEKNNDGTEAYYVIEWIDDCSYISKFDETKGILTDEMKMINSDGGIVVELLDVKDDDCIVYRSYVKKFKELSLRKGKFCKTAE